MTPATLKAARALAGLSTKELAQRAGVAHNTIRIFEMRDNARFRSKTAAALESVLAECGVVILSRGEVATGGGVAFNKSAEVG